MSHSLQVRRLEVANKLVQINKAIAAEQKRLSQIEARLAALPRSKKAA